MQPQNLIPILTILLSLLFLVPYYKTTRFDSKKGIFLVLFFLGILGLRIYDLQNVPTKMYVPETFWLSGLIVLGITSISMIIAYIYMRTVGQRAGRKFYKKSNSKIALIFAIYLFFAFLEQLFFQFIFLETFYFIVENIFVAVIGGSIFFALFHIHIKDEGIGNFTLLAMLMELFHATVYLSLGNIIWPTISMALFATFYYGFIKKEDILKYRFGDKI